MRKSRSDCKFSRIILTATAAFSYALLFFLVHPKAVFADQPRNGACRDNREEFGFALVGHDYKTVHADNFGRCFFECSLQEKCQSATYLWSTKQCKMHNETKKSRPADFEKNPAATYMENPFRAKKGSKASVPGYSCKDILISGDAQGDGEYWIDPTDSGDPFTVFCDMTTAGGGWLLITRFVMKTANSLQDQTVESDTYQAILPMYNSNNHYLMRQGLSKLKNDMGFTQIRLYCFKKVRGRVFHIMTNENSKGYQVVSYFTTVNVFPKSCGSFTKLPDDNSALANNCDKWGYPDPNRWGHSSFEGNDRIFLRPLTWPNADRFYRLIGSKYQCDDTDSKMSIGDSWQIFVR